MGTIDTFFWRFLVRPFIDAGRSRQRIETWDRINAVVDVPKSGYKLRLSDFQFRHDVVARKCYATLPVSGRNYVAWQALQKQDRLAAAAAVDARNEYGKQGYVTGHEIRVLALRALRTHTAAVTAMLRIRFSEIIVDEAQDCSNLDLAILASLHEIGLPLVFVGDPDQSIYQFRGAEPDNVRAFGATLGRCVELTGNWRSSPAICHLAASLRPAVVNRPSDIPVGEYHDDQTSILLL